MPNTKVTAAVLGGALTTLVLWGLSYFAKIDMPAEAGAALATLFSFGLGYVVSTPDSEVHAEAIKRGIVNAPVTGKQTGVGLDA